MEKNRAYFKTLLAENATEALFEELFALINTHNMRHADRLVSDKYDALVLLSGKLNAVQENHHLGLIDAGDLNTEVNRVNFALLDLLNDLPDSFFQQAQHHIAVAKNTHPTAQKRIVKRRITIEPRLMPKSCPIGPRGDHRAPCFVKPKRSVGCHLQSQANNIENGQGGHSTLQSHRSDRRLLHGSGG